MRITVQKPGLLTTVQDLGRYGYQRQGVVVSGAMDKAALRIANLLVGNLERAAALEVTQIGPALHFEQDTLITLGGAELSATIQEQPVRLWRPVLVKAGSSLHFGKPVQGSRTYVAVAGGIDVPELMGSRSTYLRAGIGGFQGRALQTSDAIPLGEPGETALLLLSELLLQAKKETAFTEAAWSPDPELLPVYQEHPELRVMRGPEFNLFSENSREYIWSEKFKVTPHSDRMGCTLQGQMLALEQPHELLSAAVYFGTVQVPPQGNPIILQADCQTTGGYPRIAQVITADLPQLAQVQTGKTIRFKEVSLEEAQQAFLLQEQQIRAIKQAIHMKFHPTHE